MDEIYPPVVVVAYNRPRSLKRLLKSLTHAAYPNKDITLVISIDRSESNSDVLQIANNFEWEYGTKDVLYHEKNLGLKNHILKCGDLSLKYGSVIVLEDDLFVSPSFYYYTIEALRFINGNSKIGGISLYNHQMNVHTNDHFGALQDGYDNWYFQFASSWGQAWSKANWMDFRSWLGENKNLEEISRIPAYVRSWSDKSWLKFYIAYLIEKNRYFIYPKISLTTNFSDAGTHVLSDSTIFQVPLLQEVKKTYNFSDIEHSKAVYDAFFESENLLELLGLTKDTCCIDLHGYKPHEGERYWLTDRILDYKFLYSYSRSLKPIEANIFCNIRGNDLFLYDTLEIVKNNNKYNDQRRMDYNTKTIKYKDLVRSAFQMTIAKRHRLFSKFKDWLK